MQNIYIHLSEKETQISQNKTILWEKNCHVFDCFDELIKNIKQLKGPKELILDHYWIKSFKFTIEEAPSKNLADFVKTQVSDNTNIPEEILECHIIDTVENLDTKSGNLLYANKKELEKIKIIFKRNNITICKITALDYPQVLFYDNKAFLIKKQGRLVALLILLILTGGIIAGLTPYNTYVSEKKLSLQPYKISYLKEQVRSKEIKKHNKLTTASKEKEQKRERQYKILKNILTCLPSCLPSAITPQKIQIDFNKRDLAINGSSKNFTACETLRENISKKNIAAQALVESIEQNNKQIIFLVRGNI